MDTKPTSRTSFPATETQKTRYHTYAIYAFAGHLAIVPNSSLLSTAFMKKRQ